MVRTSLHDIAVEDLSPPVMSRKNQARMNSARRRNNPSLGEISLHITAVTLTCMSTVTDLQTWRGHSIPQWSFRSRAISAFTPIFLLLTHPSSLSLHDFGFPLPTHLLLIRRPILANTSTSDLQIPLHSQTSGRRCGARSADQAFLRASLNNE
jgi:hypothetical protein